MGKREIYYGAALVAAPVFCLLYHLCYSTGSLRLDALFDDKKILLWGVIIFPVMEELAFRGVIQEYIAAKTKRVPSFFMLSSANILTSLLFTLLHLSYHHAIWISLVFFPSLVFGYFKEQYQRILPSIILHAFYNVNFILFAGSLR
ncbi:MAG: JDVT-CTERM system glutamic-type intramembrane protease [Sulfurimonas sp.]